MRVLLTLIASGLMVAVGYGADEHAHHHDHHVAVFVGGTHDYHSNNGFTVGLDYEYRFSDLLGVGAFIDRAGGDVDTLVAGGSLLIHPWQEMRIITALGNESQDGHNEFLVRLGIMYDFFFDDWSLSPVVRVDLLESGHQNLIYGIAFGRGF